MTNGSLSRRYARALFGLASEAHQEDAWARALAAVLEAVESSAELADVLQNPVYTAAQRRAIMARVAATLEVAAEPANLIALLCDRGRLGELPGIVRAYTDLADAQARRVRARVTSAVPLRPEEVRAITDRLAGATRGEVVLETAVDPELIGGAVAQVGDLTFDGSLRTQLEDLRRAIQR